MTSPWSAPGTTAPQPAPVPAAPTGSPVASESPEAPVLAPPPLPLRPMTIPDVLDGAFAVLKRRPREVFTLAVMFVVPIEVVSAILLRDVLGTSAIPELGGSSSSAVSVDDQGAFAGLDVTLVSIAISAASLALLAGALAHLVGRWYDGEHVTAGEAARVALRRSPALLVAVVLVHLLEVVGLLGVFVGAYVVMALLHVVSPVIVAEGTGPLRAIRRSVRLTTSRFGVSLVVPGLVGLIGALVGFGFQLVPELGAAVTPDDWDWLVRAVGQTLSQLVVVPFTAAAAVLYHLDLRIRAEGWDLERRIRVMEGG